MPIKDYTGQKFGMLTFLRPTDKRTKDRKVIWELQCDCGAITEKENSNVITGNTSHCGASIHRYKSESAFWEKVNIGATDECWEWQGVRDEKSYGYAHFKGKRQGAHRLSWFLTNGPIPDGLLVCHKCDNPPCVNPDHLFIGTMKDNMEDCANKGRIGKHQRPFGEDNGWATLTNEDVIEIRRLGAEGKLLQREIGELFGTTQVNISRILLGKSWKLVK